VASAGRTAPHGVRCCSTSCKFGSSCTMFLMLYARFSNNLRQLWLMQVCHTTESRLQLSWFDRYLCLAPVA
jgi:hypothetical protein